jgi:hypothetical protein
LAGRRQNLIRGESASSPRPKPPVTCPNYMLQRAEFLCAFSRPDPLLAGERCDKECWPRLDLWRENVLSALSEDFGIDLDRAAVTIDPESPLIDELVRAATPT